MRSAPLPFGLTPEAIAALNSVFSKVPGIEKVLVYGSRAMGTFKPGSDIDLTVVGPTLSSVDLSRIEAALDDLLLPYKIDLSLFHEIENADLVDHINRVGRLLF